ncbi:MAG: transcription elongation factor GreA [Deltaproteobacteria bacterium]|nr:transcription elongation factor GreA [Deltaproteobacteria bacterium]
MDKPPITSQGYKALQEELKNLIKVDRPKIIQDISDARAHGDLKENAEYHAAKDKQGFIEGRIQKLNHLIGNAHIIEIAKIKSNKVQFGATVTYEDLDSEETTTWKIVGEEEADVKRNLISYKSPIAKALIGKEEGDEITIKIPKGTLEVEITEVKYV